MKIILLPTDFSKPSLNAIEYAVEICKFTKSKLILFNVFSVPFTAADTALALSINEIEKNILVELNNLKKGIYLKHGNKLEIECKCACGFTLEEINLFAEKNNVDLIVTGIEGAGYLSEKIFGSLTTQLIQKAKFPVLAIDKNVIFKSIKKIVLACDNIELLNKSILKPVTKIAHLFQSQVYLLNVVHEIETPTEQRDLIEAVMMDNILEGAPYSVHYSKNDDVIEGSNNFVCEQQIDMVVMIPNTHSFFKNIFIEPRTKKMAFHTKIPLLTLH